VKKILDDLNQIKKKIEEAKREKAKYEGRLDELMKRLKEEFGIKSVQQARKKLTILEKKVDSLEEEIESRLQELKTKCNW